MYREVNGEWLAYILRMPSLNGRDGDLHLTHRYKMRIPIGFVMIHSLKVWKAFRVSAVRGRIVN